MESTRQGFDVLKVSLQTTSSASNEGAEFDVKAEVDASIALSNVEDRSLA